MLDNHGPQALGGRVDRSSKPGGPAPTIATSKTSSAHIGVMMPKASAIWRLEGLTSVVRSTPNRIRRPAVPATAGRVRAAFTGQSERRLEAGWDPVAGQYVTQFQRPSRPSLANHPDRLEATAAPAAPLPQELRDRAVELLSRVLHRTVTQ